MGAICKFPSPSLAVLPPADLRVLTRRHTQRTPSEGKHNLRLVDRTSGPGWSWGGGPLFPSFVRQRINMHTLATGLYYQAGSIVVLLQVTRLRVHPTASPKFTTRATWRVRGVVFRLAWSGCGHSTTTIQESPCPSHSTSDRRL